MSDLYTDLEAAIIALLRGAEGLAQVKTFEADVRECLFTGDKLSQGFRSEELPAIAVTAELEPAKRGPFTAGEVELTIPVSAIAVCRAQRPTDARAQARVLQLAIEKMLDQARRSDSGLGANTIVTGEFASTIVVVQEKPHCFAIAETKFQVLKVIDL
jgi:hypothetical protein